MRCRRQRRNGCLSCFPNLLRGIDIRIVSQMGVGGLMLDATTLD